MTPNGAALRDAIQLLNSPSRIAAVRGQELPEGVTLLLRIVSGETAAVAEAMEISARSPERIVQSAEFYVEQILLAQGADPYRVLGGSARSPKDLLRMHMALLLRWLHPDVGREDEIRARSAIRVTRAWNEIKTPEKRAAFDMIHPMRLDAIANSPEPSARGGGSNPLSRRAAAKSEALAAKRLRDQQRRRHRRGFLGWLIRLFEGSPNPG